MHLIIDDQIFQRFPNTKIALLIVTGLDNHAGRQILDEHLASIEASIREKLVLETLTTTPKIDDWRRAYSTFGTNPKTFKNSVESLLRRILKGNPLPRINPLVDCYNQVSVKHILPAGGEDLGAVKGNIHLTFAEGIETFIPLGTNLLEQVERGEVVYKDDQTVLCRRWNWRESDLTKLTHETTSACIVLEGLKSTTREELEMAIRELQDLVGRTCGGKSHISILDNASRKADITSVLPQNI